MENLDTASLRMHISVDTENPKTQHGHNQKHPLVAKGTIQLVRSLTFYHFEPLLPLLSLFVFVTFLFLSKRLFSPIRICGLLLGER